MIGSGIPYFLMSAIQFLLGNFSQALQILFLTLGLQLLRRVLEPKLMSDSIGISPLESLVGMFVGMRFGGIVGLIGGLVGDLAFALIGLQSVSPIGNMIVSIIGACIVVFLYRKLKK